MEISEMWLCCRWRQRKFNKITSRRERGGGKKEDRNGDAIAVANEYCECECGVE